MENIEDNINKLLASIGTVSSVEQKDVPPTQAKTNCLQQSLKRSDSRSWQEKYLGLNLAEPKIAHMAEMTEWWCRSAGNNVPEQRRMLVISGPTGTGKSHVARAARNYLEQGQFRFFERPAARWSSPPCTYFADWSKTVGAKTDEEFEYRLDGLTESKFAIFDDVGAEVDKYKSGEPTERLRRTLELCDRQRKWVLITTNIPDDGFEARYDERVADRIRAAWFVNTSGVKSWRGK